MTPDDPRHGTYAGFMAHRRDRTDQCDPCSAAGAKARKLQAHRRATGQTSLVPIGQRAWQIAKDAVPQALADEIGVNRSAIYKIRRRGPSGKITRTVKTAILTTGRSVTYIGLQRRLQAATAIGHSMEDFAARTDGVRRETLNVIRSNAMQFICGKTRREIIRVYDELEPAQDSTRATRCRNYAAKMMWAAPLAWEYVDIDDPNAQPEGVRTTGREIWTGFDEAAVRKRMAGDRAVVLNAAEQLELVNRMVAADWSQGRIEEHTGINASRVLRENRAAGAESEAA